MWWKIECDNLGWGNCWEFRFVPLFWPNSGDGSSAAAPIRRVLSTISRLMRNTYPDAQRISISALYRESELRCRGCRAQDVSIRSPVSRRAAFDRVRSEWTRSARDSTTVLPRRRVLIPERSCRCLDRSRPLEGPGGSRHSRRPRDQFWRDRWQAFAHVTRLSLNV